jgi:hypothetical protein
MEPSPTYLFDQLLLDAPTRSNAPDRLRLEVGAGDSSLPICIYADRDQKDHSIILPLVAL